MIVSVGLTVYWELGHPTRSFYWLDFMQNILKSLGNSCFTIVTVWIFFICGQFVVLNFESIEIYLKILKSKNARTRKREWMAGEILKTLCSTKQLNSASCFLHRCFALILLATCLLTSIVLLTSSYFFIVNFNGGRNKLLTLWDGISALNAFINFCLMCHISDRMRQAVTINHGIKANSMVR